MNDLPQALVAAARITADSYVTGEMIDKGCCLLMMCAFFALVGFIVHTVRDNL